MHTDDEQRKVNGRVYRGTQAANYFAHLHELMAQRATEERRRRILAELDRIEAKLQAGPKREVRRRAAARQRKVQQRAKAQRSR